MFSFFSNKGEIQNAYQIYKAQIDNIKAYGEALEKVLQPAPPSNRKVGK